MRIGKITALGLICALFVAFAATPAHADVVMDQTFGMVYLVFGNGSFDSYAGYGGGEVPPGYEGFVEGPSFETYTIIAYAQQIGGVYPNSLQFNVAQNLPSSVRLGDEYFYFGAVMGSEHLGISSPQGPAAPIPDVPGPPSWEQAILGGLKNMDMLDPNLGALGGSTVVTSDQLWGFLAAMQPPPEFGDVIGPGLVAYSPELGFSDVDFADIVNFRANMGENQGFISFDPISELFSTNEDAFSGFTDPTGAGLFIMNALPVNSVILNPPGSPGGYISQNQLVPEPATLGLLLAAAGLACARRRKRNAA